MLSGFSSAVARAVARVPGGKYFWFFAGLFSAATCYVFSAVLSRGWALTSPDDPPFYVGNFFVMQTEQFLSGKGYFIPQRLFHFFDPVLFHEYNYAVSLFLLGLSCLYYLRTQGVSMAAASGGGLFAAFSGYIMTLFCAGHVGFFFLFSMFFWSLGLMDRCLRGRRLWSFMMLGCVVMWGQPVQSDIWILNVALLAAYTLWRLTRLVRSGEKMTALLVVLVPRFLLALAIAGLVGVSGIRLVLEQQLAGRDKQIEELSGAGGDSQQASPDQAKQKAFDRWVFATGWSLPPEDCAEFLVPGIFGNDSFQPPYPYWGRLGQPYAFQPGKMMPNYRSHTVYLGLISVILAFFGVFAWLSFRRAKDVSPLQPPSDLRPLTSDLRPPPSALRSPTPNSSLLTPDFSDVPFWCAVWLVCLILAMGRYTPVYKLFYAIPYMDYLRAPVKLLHLTEVATALLAGFGLEALLSDRTSLRLRRGFVWGVAVLAGVLGVAALALSLNGAALERHIAALGLGQFAAVLPGYAVANCLRAIALALGVAGLFWLSAARMACGRSVTAVVLSLIVLGVADLASVARRHVIPVNVQPFHEANPVIREMQKRTEGRTVNVANYVTRNVWGQDWFNTALTVNGFPNMVPDPANPGAAERPFAEAMQNDPLRFWQVMGVRFVMLPRQQAEPFIRQGLLASVGEFELGSGAVRRAGSGGNAFVLAEVRQGALPRVYFAWTGNVAPTQQVEQACRSGQVLPVTDAPSATSPRPPQPAPLMRVRGERGVFVTQGAVDLPEPGLLVWNDRYSADLMVRVDGKSVPLRQADGLWCAVEVPAGKHTVACRMVLRPFWNLLALSVGVFVTLCACVAGRKSATHGAGTNDRVTR